MVQGYYGVVYGCQITRVPGRMAVREDLTVIVWIAWLLEYKVLRCMIVRLLGTLFGCRYVQGYYCSLSLWRVVRGSNSCILILSYMVYL
jgi:hypothetical protein